MLCRRIDTGAEGFIELLELLAPWSEDPAMVPVAIETDKNLLVVALRAAGFSVYPINTLAVARYRERHGQAGTKSDPGDARVLADVLRADIHRHRRLPEIAEHAATIRALARQHQEAIWALQQTANRLRSVLLEFYPQALQAFPNLQHKATQAVLAAAPTPAAGAKLTPAKVVALLRKCGRRNDTALVERVVVALRTPALRQPDQVETALGLTTQTLLAVIAAQQAGVESLAAALTEVVDTHPLAPVIRSAPGLGPVLGAGCSLRSATTPPDSLAQPGFGPTPGPPR